MQALVVIPRLRQPWLIPDRKALGRHYRLVLRLSGNGCCFRRICAAALVTIVACRASAKPSVDREPLLQQADERASASDTAGAADRYLAVLRHSDNVDELAKRATHQLLELEARDPEPVLRALLAQAPLVRDASTEALDRCLRTFDLEDGEVYLAPPTYEDEALADVVRREVDLVRAEPYADAGSGSVPCVVVRGAKASAPLRTLLAARGLVMDPQCDPGGANTFRFRHIRWTSANRVKLEFTSEAWCGDATRDKERSGYGRRLVVERDNGAWRSAERGHWTWN